MTNSSDSYTASLNGSNGTESIELEFVNGLPRKSFVRPADGGEEIVWELVPDADGFEYREAGISGADYS